MARLGVCQPAMGKEKGPAENPADPLKIRDLQANAKPMAYCG
jgi:hypothetical protein